MDRETFRKKFEADVAAKKAENQAKREALAKKFVADVEAYKKKSQEWTPALPGSAKLAMQNAAMERAKAEQERKRIEVESNIRSQTLHENIEHSDELVEKREKEAETNYKMLTVKERNLLPKNERADFNVRTYDFAAGDDESERLKAEVDAAKATLEKAKRDNLYYTDLTAYLAASNAYDEANARYKAFEAEHRTKGYELEALRTKDSVRRVMSTNVSDIDAAIAKLEAKSFGLEELEAKKRAAWSEFSAAYYVGGTYRANAESEYDKAEDQYNKALSAKKENEANIYYLNGIKSFSLLTQERQEEIIRIFGIFSENTHGAAREDWEKAAQIVGLTKSMSKEDYDRMADDFNRMMETLFAMHNAISSAELDIKNAKFANEHPITASTISVFANLLGGVASVADVASHTLSNIGAKPGYVTPIDKNASTFALTKGANMMRGEVSAKIERSFGGVGGKIASFLYQTGMSGVDSFAASFTGNWGGALLLGSGAASNAFLDAKERGVSDSQAIWTGLLAGTFESLFERLSIGNINALKEVPPATVKAVLSNVAKSAGVNAFEEGVTEAANLVSDYFINLDKSALSQTYDGYVKQGMSESRAKWATFGSILGQTISAGIGGAIMGVGMSGSVGTVGYLSNKGVNTAAGARYIGADGNVDTAAAEALINLGKASANETIRNYATKLGKNVAKLDIKELGQLQRMLNAEKGADVKPKTIDLPNGMKPNDVVTIMEDDGSLRVMTAEDAAAAGKFEPIGSQKRKTGTNLQNGEKTPTSENLTVRGVSGDLEAEVKKTVRHVNAASAMSESADVKVYSALSGTVNNAVADNIANTPELSAAFEKMLGVELKGSLSQKRKVIKDNALRLTENYRIENSERVTGAVRRAEDGNDSELMLNAVGDFGGAIYRTIVDKGVRAAAIKGVLAHQQFNADFGGYYIDGYKGRGFAYNDRIISEEDARAVYNAAARDAALANATSVTERSGIIAGATKENIALIERLSKALKRDILFVNMPVMNGETFNGCYSKDGKIYINVNAKDALVKVVAHEFTHSLESRGLYGTFLEFVFDTLAKEGKTKEQLLGDKRNSASVYKNKSDPELEHEIVAQFVEERLLTDEKVMRDIVREKGKSFAGKLHDVLNSLIEKIKAVFGKNTEGWTLKQLNAVEKGRKMLAEVIKSEDVGDAGEDLKFDLNLNLGQQLNDWMYGGGKKNGAYNGEYFELGTTPSVMIKHGAPNAPLIMYEDCIIKVTGGKHSIAIDEIAKLPQQLNDPILFFKGSVPNSFVALTELKAKNGHDVIAAIHINKRKDRTVVNKIASIYSKTDKYDNNQIENYVFENIRQGNLLDASNEKAPIWFTSRGLQLPKLVQTIISANNRIPQKNSGVNSNSMQKSEDDADGISGFSFAGKTAKTANFAKLTEAQRMESDGADSETIRKATGWHKGYDGKWRFEIDDSKMILFKGGDALFSQNHPEYVELQELYNKLFYGSITDAEHDRLIELDEIWGREHARLAQRVDSGNATLENIIQHDELFEAYPELREVRIVFEGMDSGTNGSYDRITKTIKLGEHLLKNEFKLKKTLLHEIQHAVQHIEGFAEGSNPASWELKKKNDLEESKKAHDDTLETILSFDNGNHLDKWREYNRGEIELSELLAEESYTQDEKELFLKHIQNSQRYLALRNDSRSGELLYEKTAGEIEARDISARSDLDAEQRKNTRPDIDRTDVVFADGGGASYSIGETDDGRPVVVVNDDITKYASNDKSLVNLVKQSIGKFPYVAISRQKIFFTDDTKRETTYSKYTKWLRKNDSKVYLDKMRLFSHPSEIVLATTDFVNEGLNHPRKDDIIDFARGKLLVDVLGKQYSAEVVIGFTKKGICELHDVLKLTPTKFKYKTRDALSTISHNDEHLQKRSSLATNSISNPNENVKGKDDIVFSVSSNDVGEGSGSDVATTEDEFLARMLYYRDNPEAAAQAKADYVIQNAELEAKGRTNFIDGAINTQPRIVKKRFADEVSKSWQFVKRKMVDSGDAVTRIGKEVKDSRLYAYYNMARASTNAAAYMITGVQTDISGKKVGEGLNSIFAPIKSKGDEYYREFQKYLYHLHNIDRMSRQNGDRADYARNVFEKFRVEHPELLRYTDSEIERMIYNADDHINKAAAMEYIRLRDEMVRESGMKNKPVWGHEVGAAHSMAASQALEHQHPEFKELRDKVYAYIDNLMKYRVESGLVTNEDAESLKAVYPHYVPTYRITDDEGVVGRKRKNSTVVGKTVGRAEGGDEPLMPLDQALAKLTLKVVREGSKNRFGTRLMYNGAVKVKKHIKNIREFQPMSMDSFATADLPDNDVDALFKKANTFVIHDNGQMWEMEISDELYEAVKALSPEPEEMTAFMNFVRGTNKLYKELITGKNPLFIVKNFARDLQDAVLYTTDFAGFIKAYPKAWKEMCSGGELWQQYQALGGLYSSVFDYRTGMADKKAKNIIGKALDKIEFANMLIEQAPRFAEFISTVERGGSKFDNLMTAMYNAADITVNFGRSGEIGKWLNSTFIPFFNPGVQGFDKTVRMFKDNKGGRAWLALATKAILLGIAPTFLNEIFALFGDWENWDDVKQRDKDTYYLINIGRGRYVKIPKGRVTALLSMSAMRVMDVIRGKEVDLGDYLATLGDQVAPASPFESNIVMPWIQTALFDKDNPGKTWYGGDIESQRLRNYAPGERFDENTDLLSKWIGKTFNLSPKKINYLLDSYTGVAGDLLIPILTPNKGGISAAWNVITKTFVLDSVSSNKLNESFYDKLDSLTHSKNSSNAGAVDKLMYRYFNKQATFVSDINTSIKKIQNDASLTDAERKELLRVQQGLRNEIEKTALGMLGEYQKEVEYYYNYSLFKDEEDKIEDAYLMANKTVFGAEYAIKVYNSNTYKKAQACYDEGVSYEDFFAYYFPANNIELSGFEKSNKKREILMNMESDDNTKKVLYREYISDSRDEDIAAFAEVGLSFNEFLRAHNQYAFADATCDKAKEKSDNFAKWVNKQKYTRKQKEVVLDCFKYFMHIPT